jgi:16S rRNA (adenine1518-N6/adenine1519-N6)-dimethyltransferase
MRAKKELGQHFLIQEGVAERLAKSIDTTGCGAIVEIGPGKGILTRHLLDLSLPVYAVELDRDMIPILERDFHDPRLHVIHGDILRVNLVEHLGPDGSFVLAGNFPYNISSQIVFLGLQLRERIPFMAGMFQKEMAARICSPPGSKVYGVISVLAQAYYKAEMLFNVKPGSFSPPPKVDSAVIALRRYRTEIEGVPYRTLRQVVKLAFQQRRKKLRNSLMGLIDESLLREEGVVDLRPEQIGVEQFISLARLLADQPAD